MTLPHIVATSIEPMGIPSSPRPNFWSLETLRTVFGTRRVTGTRYKTLDDFPATKQELRYWCWAAVAYNINEYLRLTSPQSHLLSEYSQGSIAETQHEGCHCTDAQLRRLCNKPGSLKTALETLGLTPRAIPTNRPPILTECRTEIENNRPIAVRVSVSEDNDSWHLFVIYGVGVAPNKRLAVWDPRGNWIEPNAGTAWVSDIGTATHIYLLPEHI